MAIKNAIYKVDNGSTFDEIMFKTVASQVTFTDGKTFQQKLDDGSLKGPTGNAGATGAKGATGPTGPAGSNGIAGATGPTGPAGSNGIAGAIGPTGPAGSNGTAGTAGAKGATGPTGPAGSNGTAGTAGAKGATGPTGPAGSNGTAGTAGAKGATGPTGPAGSNGTAGTAGAKGATGPTGPNAVSTSTTTTGFTNGHILYNNNGKVGAKSLSASDVGAATSAHSHSINGVSFTSSNVTIPTLSIQTRTTDPSGSANGTIWFRTDL